jgi:hypothetical protein
MSQPISSRELVEGFIDGNLDEARLAELKQALQEESTLRASMVMELRLRGLLRSRRNDSSGMNDAVTRATDGFSPKSYEEKIMGIINVKANPPLPFKSTPKASSRLARAAAWLGAFTWFGNKAQAAGTGGAATSKTGTFFTLKTASTAIVLLLGGGVLYLIHQNNQESAASIEQLQARKEAILNSPAESPSTRTPISATNQTNASPQVTANKEYLDALCDKLEYLQDVREGREASVGMDAMNLEALKQLLEDAQKTERHYKAVYWILGKMAERFPADATVLGAKIVATRSPFDSMVSEAVGECFLAWLQADPKAADQWYGSAMASGELIPKSLPEGGMENYLPERILSKHRFQVMLQTDSEKAVSMVADMLEGDVAQAMSSYEMDFSKAEILRDPISRIAGQLTPEQQKVALGRYVGFLGSQGFTAASKWLDAVDIDATTRTSLLSSAATSAYASKKLTKAEALQIIDSLPDYPERKKDRRNIEERNHFSQ